MDGLITVIYNAIFFHISFTVNNSITSNQPNDMVKSLIKIKEYEEPYMAKELPFNEEL